MLLRGAPRASLNSRSRAGSFPRAAINSSRSTVRAADFTSRIPPRSPEGSASASDGRLITTSFSPSVW